MARRELIKMGRNIVNGSSATAATIWKKATSLRPSLKLIILVVLLLTGIFLVYAGSSGDLARLLRSANLASWIQSSYKEARAERLVRESWQRIIQAGQYDFSTTVEQITYPAPKLSNVGASSTRDVYHISGRADLAQRKLLVSLWQNSGSLMNTQDGLEIRIEDGQTWGRTAGGEWRELDSFSASAFAPGNDAASFLTSARNVQLKEYVALNLSPVEGKTVQFKSAHYTFDVDSNRLAAFMRDQMVAELQRAGKLPAGLHLELSDEYLKMTGNGEVWIGADGLPLRITMVMKFPAAKTGERIEAHLSTDFFAQQQDSTKQAASLYLLGRLGGSAQKMAFSAMAWLDSSGSSSSGLLLFVACIALVLFFAAALLLSQRDLKSSLIYRLVACLVISSTLATPLWDGSKAQAYNQYAQSQAQQQAARQQQSKIDRQSVDDMYSMDWDPQVSPYVQVDPPLVFGGQPIENGTTMAPLYDRNFSPLEAEPGGEEADSG